MGEEKVILKLQYGKPIFARLGEGELLVVSQILLGKISIITGWVIPDNTSFATVLNDQFAKKLKEEYYTLNPDEVEYAFRKYGSTVDDWGKTFNLNLIDKVLVKYLSYRNDIREFAEKVKIEQEEVKALPPAKQSDVEFIEDYYSMWRSFKNKFYQYIDSKVYDKLQKAGLMDLSEEDKARIRTTVKADNRSMDTNLGFKELRHMLTEIQEAPDNMFIHRLCKKYAVAEFFNKLIAEGKEKVF